MNFKRQQLIIDLLRILMHFMIAYLFITVILYLFIEDAALYVLFLLPAPFLSYAINRYTKHIWSFLLLHAALLALYGITSRHLFLVILNTAYLVWLASSSFYLRQKKPGQERILMQTAAVFPVLYLLCHLAKMPKLQPLCFAFTIVFILLNVLRNYLMNLSQFARNHEDIRNMPFQQIRNSNHVLMAFLCGLFLAAMLLFSRFPLGSVLSYTGTMLKELLRFLLSLIRFSEAEEAPPPEPETKPEVPDDFGLPPAESSPIMELIAEILQRIVLVLAAAGIVALLLYSLYRLYRYFYLKSEGGVAKDEVEFISPYIKRDRAKREKKTARRWLFGRSNNQIIRKSFAQAVSANTKGEKKLAVSMTPSQLSEYALGKTKLSPSASEDERKKKELLTSYYEKARYSDEECTKSEVKQVKELLK